MDRRDFVDKAKILSAGTILLTSFLIGCEDTEEQEENKYVPQVNSIPYFERN